MMLRWPNSQDYNEAVQCPDICFDDQELRGGSVELTPLGLPKVASGNFASVYRFNCGNSSYGVKCFLRNVYGQHQRYAQLSQFTSVTGVPHMVDFEYQLKGIYVEGGWFPILKMQWVEGVGLDQFLRKNWSNKLQIDRVIGQFVELVQGLQKAGMAHGDLQHGNVMVRNDALRLVDYDGMYVPSMAGQAASELGHANYQHPQRNERDFGPALDNFSAWLIYYSLFFLKLDPSLWQRFEGGDDCLIFRKSDFVDPDRSRLLAELARHPIPDICSKFELVRALLKSPLDRVPKFSVEARRVAAPVPPTAGGLLAGGATASSSHPTIVTGTNWEALSDVTEQKLAPAPAKWPTAESYYRALRTPVQSLTDENLSKCLLCSTFGKSAAELDVDADGITFDKAVIKGRRHSVFRMALIDGSRYYAVKCFSQHEPERQMRYDAIKRYKKTASNRYFTQFLYQPDGIMIGSDTLAIVKMLWVNGETIEHYVARQLKFGNADAVSDVIYKFREMIGALAVDGIAHGDLEPRNIMVDQQGELKLIDYDAMYVPALAHLQSCELGQSGYQHPSRNLSNYGPYLDNYSALLIDGILSCLTADPPQNLWQWEALLQYVKQKADPRNVARQPDPRSGAPRQLIKGATPFEAPRLDTWRSDAPVQQSKFEAQVTKLARTLKDIQRFRVDVVPPLSASRTLSM